MTVVVKSTGRDIPEVVRRCQSHIDEMRRHLDRIESDLTVISLNERVDKLAPATADHAFQIAKVELSKEYYALKYHVDELTWEKEEKEEANVE